MQCEFIQVIAKDGVNLEGLVFSPVKQAPTVVGVWIHGLGSNFHRNYNRLVTLARVFGDHGLIFASIDTRGHDWISHAVKNDKRKTKGYRSITIGAAYEKFKDSQLDLEAIVAFLTEKYGQVVLLGHSTGANKVVYYLSRKENQKKVLGAVLVAPVSDVPSRKKDLGENYAKALVIARQMIKEGRGQELMPRELIRPIYTARRFWGLATHEDPEQLFPDRQFRGPLRLFSKICVPMLIVLAQKDMHMVADKITNQEILAVFGKYSHSSIFDTEVIPEADHGFSEKEKELGEVLAGWIKKL